MHHADRQRVARLPALHLGREGPTVAAPGDAGVTQVVVQRQFIDAVAAVRMHGDLCRLAAHYLAQADVDILVVPFLAEHADGEVALGQGLEALPELPLQALGAVAVEHVQARGQRHQEAWVGVRHVGGGEAVRVMLGDEAGVEVAGHELRVRQQRRLERDVALHALDDEAIERLTHAGDGIRAVLAVHDQLGDHRVVEHRDLATVDDAGIDTHAMRDRGLALLQVRRGRRKAHQATGGGQEAAERVFGVDAALHGPAFALHVGLRKAQLLARGHADHLFDQIEAGDQLGHRVLDLQARVHLQEVEVLVLADHELHRAGRLVLHRLGQLHRLLAHGLAGGLADEGRRRLFDDLLVAALDGTFALIEVHHVAVRVAQHLDLDVARLLDELFDEHAVVAKAVAGLVAAGAEALVRLLVVEGHAQALAAAAGAGLDHHRVADSLGDLYGLLGRVDRVVVAGNGVDLGFVGQLLGGDLVAHGRDAVVLGPDEDQALLFDLAREGLVLAQEAIARVDGLRPRGLGRLDDLVAQQVGLTRGRRAQAHGLISQLDKARAGVGVGIHRHRSNAHALGGGDDAAGDLAAVGDQDFLEHFKARFLE